MKKPFYIFLVVSLSFYGAAQEQAEPPLPTKLASLKTGYEAAIARTALPITQTYIQELQKLKAESTRAANLEAALATDRVLKSLAASSQVASNGSAPTKLSQMKIGDFKKWLRTVIIVESNGEKTTYQFDGTSMISSRPKLPAPRTHKGTEVEVGVISVPFSTDLGVIRVSDDLLSATVRYDSEPELEARIIPKQ